MRSVNFTSSMDQDARVASRPLESSSATLADEDGEQLSCSPINFGVSARAKTHIVELNLSHNIGDLFVTLLKRICVRPRPLPIYYPQGLEKSCGATHSMPIDEEQSRTAVIWKLENEFPRFDEPKRLTELQVWHRGRLKRFHGEHAALRMRLLAPTFFSAKIGEREGSVGIYRVDCSLSFMLTGQSLARSYIGATGVRMDPVAAADWILDRRFYLPPRVTGEHKNRRFYEGVVRLYVTYYNLAKRYKRLVYLKLGILLVQSMLEAGRSESPLLTYFSKALNCMLHGTAADALENWLLSLPINERGMLWKTRRLFTKDDNLPLDNSLRAIQRMTIPRSFTSEQEIVANSVFTLFESNASRFVDAHLDRLKQKHDSASLHRSSASLFFSRNAGGGAGELALTIALYRLSQGQRACLNDPWGQLSEHVPVSDLMSWLSSQDERRAEVMNSCSWFLDEIKKREISFPFLCIYPEREPKSRTFMMLPYALQMAGSQAAFVVADYLRSREDTREVYSGFQTGTLMRKIRQDIKEGASHMLSLDSAVATDSLPHKLCQRVFRPFYPAFSDYTRKALEMIFGPTKVHVAKDRPKPFIKVLAFESTLGKNIGLKCVARNIPATKWPPNEGYFVTREAEVPTHLRTYPLRQEIIEAIQNYDRVILVSPTGSGKTVLAASLFNAIIQFPSVASLEIFSGSLTAMGITHNVWYSLKKETDNWCEESGEPRTILCTSFFVPQLAERYPNMIIALDEADTKQENYLLNLHWSKKQGRATLLMTATPDELRGEENTHRITLPGGTNFPIQNRYCTESEMLDRLRDPASPQSLICSYSEPHCEKLARLLQNSGKRVLLLTTARRQTDYVEELNAADIILSTNVVRSSITLPNLVEVYDIGRVYENVDFPISGFETLILMRVSASMKTQLRGRVGRLQEGVYWTVTGIKGSVEPYDPRMLCRLPGIAATLGKIPQSEWAREINLGSTVIERFHQEVCARLGIHRVSFRPLWVSIMRRLCDSRRRTLLTLVGFEMSGIANRLRQVEDDDDIRDVFERFKRANHATYVSLIADILIQLSQFNWFKMELAQLYRWGEGLVEDPQEELYTESNMRAVSLALWRSVAISHNGTLTGCFRNFTVTMPSDFPIPEGNYCIVLGLSLAHTALTARSTMLVQESTFNWLKEQLQTTTVVPGIDDVSAIPIVEFTQVNSNKGTQRRSVHLCWDQYGTMHHFEPSDSERIWEAMLTSLESQKASLDFTTVQGSPMSSTASFSVLNSFGLAAHDWVRAQTSERLHSASVFGDDDFVVGTELACLLDQQAREASGLITKLEATGLIDRNKFLSDPAESKSFALFTERVICPRTIREIPTIKPAGMFRLFQAYHNDQVIFTSPTFLPDMQHYATQIQRKDPFFYKILTEKPSDVRNLHPRRVTAPRRILQKLLLKELGPHDRIAIGPDVDRLFDALEGVLLQFYPSTRGLPDRIEVPKARAFDHCIIGLNDARNFSNALQEGRCYFAMKGPPLQFGVGPFAIEAAIKELRAQGIDINQFPDPSDMFRAMGWGDPYKHKRVHMEPKDLSLHLEEEAPIDYLDVVD